MANSINLLKEKLDELHTYTRTNFYLSS